MQDKVVIFPGGKKDDWRERGRSELSQLVRKQRPKHSELDKGLDMIK